MALTILNEQYPPRKPKLTLTADSLDELPTEGVAEGSTATVDGTEYAFDSNAGWIEPGAGGGGSGGGVFWVSVTSEDGQTFTADKTIDEIVSAHNSGNLVMVNDQFDYQGVAPANCDIDNATAYATVVNVDTEKHITFVTIGIVANLVTGGTDVSYDVTHLQGT